MTNSNDFAMTMGAFDRIDQESRDILKRLEIDREKERKILLERYRKRTRLILTDSELIDYLEFLRKELKKCES